VDLGSGNGELVVEAARLGLQCEVTHVTQHRHSLALAHIIVDSPKGFELNWILVAASRCRAWVAGPLVHARTAFHWRRHYLPHPLNATTNVMLRSLCAWRNMWEAELCHTDVVCVFGVPEIMAKLEAKFNSQLQPGTVVVNRLCCLRWL
jgi:hypothetical protein